MKGLRSADWQLRSSHGGVKHSTGNTVITMHGARRVVGMSGGHFGKDTMV